MTRPNASARPRATARIVYRALDLVDIGAGRSWGAIDASSLPDRKDGSCVSVDVYDTVITRRLSTDAAVARAAATRAVDTGLWSGSIDSYIARRRAGAERSLAIDDWFDDPELADNERQVEESLLGAIPGAAEGLDRLRTGGVDIVFVSDMHFDAESLRHWLNTLGLLEETDIVLSSSALGMTKADGALHRFVAENHAPIAHIGNDLWGDISMAVVERVRPLPIRSAESNRYEQHLGRRPEGIGPALAAAARLTRLAAEQDESPHTALRSIGADVLGPTMVAFVQWARRRSLDRGITDLVFLARDARLPMEVFENLPADHRAGLTAHYLEGSRRTWSLPAASTIGVERWIDIGTADTGSFLNHSLEVIPFEAVLERCGLVIGDIPDGVFASHDPATPLPAHLAPEWDSLLRSDRLMSTISIRSDAALAALKEHLRSTSLPSRPLSLIDIGWRGQLAWMIDTVISSHLGVEIQHLHFGGLDVIAGLPDELSIQRFAIDDSKAPLPFPSPVSCLESFTASGERSLRAVRSGPTGPEPIYAPPQPLIFGDAKRQLWQGALDMAALTPSLAELERLGVTELSLAPEICAILADYWVRPSAIEAQAGTELHCEIDDAGEALAPLVVPYGFRELITRSPKPRQWRHGSLRASPLPLRLALGPLIDRHQ